METLEELRKKVSFQPLAKGYASFRTHCLSFSRRGMICVDVCWFAFLFCAFFGCVGIALTSVAVVSLIQNHFVMKDPVFASVPGIIFIAVAVWILYSLLAKRAVFNFYASEFVSKKKRVPFSRIAALQVVGRYIYSNRSSFYVWELNLVLDDASRINVFVHGNKKGFDADVEALSKRLGRPVWTDENWNEYSEEPYVPSKKSKVGLCCFSFVFLFFPLFLWYLLVGKPLMQVVESRQWERCPATVVHSKLSSSRGNKGRTMYGIDIHAQYTWKGKTYVCEYYDFFLSRTKSNIGVSEKRFIVKSFPVGKKIELFVNPESPGESVMSRGVPVSSVLLFSAFFIVFLIFGLFALLSGLGVIRTKTVSCRKRRTNRGRKRIEGSHDQ